MSDEATLPGTVTEDEGDVRLRWRVGRMKARMRLATLGGVPFEASRTMDDKVLFVALLALEELHPGAASDGVDGLHELADLRRRAAELEAEDEKAEREHRLAVQRMIKRVNLLTWALVAVVPAAILGHIAYGIATVFLRGV